MLCLCTKALCKTIFCVLVRKNISSYYLILARINSSTDNPQIDLKVEVGDVLGGLIFLVVHRTKRRHQQVELVAVEDILVKIDQLVVYYAMLMV